MKIQVVPSILPSGHDAGVQSVRQIDGVVHKDCKPHFQAKETFYFVRKHLSVQMLGSSSFSHWQSLQALRC